MMSTTLRQSSTGATVGLRAAGTGEPVVLLHGVGMQSAAWAPQFDGLAQTHHVIALDLPGHGASTPLPVGSDLPAFVAWLHDVVHSFDLGPVNIVGHSMGALIAGGFAVEHPALTRRVALLNGVFQRSPQARRAVEARAAEIAQGQANPATPLARWFTDSPTDLAAKAHVAGWLAQVDPKGYATAYAAFAKGDATYAERFPEIACPLLALTADGDANSTPEMSQVMASHVAGARAVIVEGHRHMVNLTAPDVVTHHLKTWLARAIEPEVVS